jgi:hypothetical protein
MWGHGLSLFIAVRWGGWADVAGDVDLMAAGGGDVDLQSLSLPLCSFASLR